MYRDEALAELVVQHGADSPFASRIADGRAGRYNSMFQRWNERASVRTKPARVLDAGGTDQPYFSPELVPLLSHPLVAGVPQQVRWRILVQRLYQYLHFTTELEALAVIPVAAKISRGRAGLALPEAMRHDAFKIVTDEAWHAQFSFDLMRQVQAETGVNPHLPELPQFVDRLDAIHRRLEPDLRGLENLIFSIVSETLISTILAELPRDDRLPAGVREMVQDHAEDEGRHHAYFRSLLTYLWPALGQDQRERLGPGLPEVIFAFLEPDYGALRRVLAEAQLSAAEVEQVLAESYPRESVVADIATAAKAPVRYFSEMGALADGRTYDAFATAGLI
jgi:P-aminobenzoate N-oxygenase AurF